MPEEHARETQPTEDRHAAAPADAGGAATSAPGTERPSKRPTNRSTKQPQAPREGATPESGEELDRAERRKQQLLTQGKPSVTRGIADAIVIKDRDLFFLSEPDGGVPMDRRHGLGLYYHDCRYLNGYDFRLADTMPNLLVASGTRGYEAIFEYANPEIDLDSELLIAAEQIAVGWTRVVDGEALQLHDRLTFRDFGRDPVELPISLNFRAEFEDVYAVRGLLAERPGKLRQPVWNDDVLRFAYEGADGILRATSVAFDTTPTSMEGTRAIFRLPVNPRETTTLDITISLEHGSIRGDGRARTGRGSRVHRIEADLERDSDAFVHNATRITSDGALLNRVIERSLRDLQALRSTLDEHRYFAAGVPWFVTLFGRDAAVTALQTLAFDPRIAEQTLRLLAEFQGSKVDEWRDEQPGKMLHELRVGEFANLGEIPHTPYYGTVDATPLFLILLARHAAWTGDLSLFHELRPNVDRALEWIDEYGDLDGDGYVEYHSTSAKGLVNQGWKDSGDAIVNEDGSLADPPIALVEVQGYVYRAKREIAALFRRDGDIENADRLLREAADLRERFNRDFWLEDRGQYAMALQGGGRPCAVASSNPGHALWADIADDDKARKTAKRLVCPEMFSGWGVRTLASTEKRYNPIGYHLGTVWPHDNSIIAAGLRRYGFDNEARRIFRGIMDAASYFKDHRLPEAFSGFPRDGFSIPIRYPVACHPQAWAAGTAPYLMQILLGLRAEAFERRLRIVRPIMPEMVDRLDVKGLRVGDARVDLCFTRTETGAAVQTLNVEGDLAVIIEQGVTRRSPL